MKILSSRSRSRGVALPEESILLRILTQSLVTIAIVGMDVAAGTSMSLWAVPLSSVGALWSWFGRHQRSLAKVLKAGQSIALIAISVIFVMRFFQGQLTDLRLGLAELLIQMQVLHSLDLQQRRDLGYSIVIGLLLLGVASTVSQTPMFGLFLLAFLAIALPTLQLEYRSRLGMSSAKLNASITRVLNLPNLIRVFGISLVLGLILFAVMPRFPSPQPRSMPTSQTFNPGLIPEQQVRSGQRQGKKLDDNVSYHGFGDNIDQNWRGQLKPQMVMRVRSQVKSFWRVMAFDRYTGQGWSISRQQTATVKPIGASAKFLLPTLPTLTKVKAVPQTYMLTADLGRMVPAIAQAKELYFPTPEIAVDSERNVRSPEMLTEGLTYSVISEVSYQDADAWKVSSTNPDVSDRDAIYLQLPTEIKSQIEQQTRSILATSSQELASTYEKATYLGQYLKQHYTIQLQIPKFDRDDDVATIFLTKHKGGYPDHFSTTLTVMLRSIGIPSRLVTGFAPGNLNFFTGLYEVRNSDAHAMTEVKVPNYGWFAIDPIPGHPLTPPTPQENHAFSGLQQLWERMAQRLPSPVAQSLNKIFAAIGRFFSMLGEWFSKSWIGAIAIGVGLVAIALIPRGWKKWQHDRWLNSLPPMERLYQQMLHWQAKQGVAKHPAQTPLEYAQDAKSNVVQEISKAYAAWRYGSQTPNVNDLRSQFQDAKRAQKRTR